MKKSFITFILILIAASMLLSLTAFGEAPDAEAPELKAEASEIPEAEPEVQEPAKEEKAEEPRKYGQRRIRYDTAWIDELKATLPELPDVDIESWEFLLANSYNSINTYMPKEYGGFEGQGLDARVVDAVQDFIGAARKEGYQVYMATGLRNTEYNKNRFIHYCNETGSAAEACKVFLPLGCSDHQTGLAIDLTADPQRSAYFGEFSNEEFLETEVYKWALEHCSEYGFINRYPEGKEEFYGYPCHCAGHFRYVGVEAAKYITENNLCLEEFIALYDPSLLFIPSKISD